MPPSGFESFSLQLHKVIEKEGTETFYVFDCLSDLLSAWATDLMIGNFFLITCPYLFDMNTLAYFAILRNSHSFKTIARIRETTQVLLEIYKFNGSSCIHPLKAMGRYSPTMFLPHIKKGDEFVPITNSSEAADLFLHMSKKGLGLARRNLDYWDRLFMEVEDLLARNSPPKQARAMVDKVSSLLIGQGGADAFPRQEIPHAWRPAPHQGKDDRLRVYRRQNRGNAAGAEAY